MIGGLITSTLLTLSVVPVVYTLLDDLVICLRRGRGTSAHTPRVIPAMPPPAPLSPAPPSCGNPS